MQSSTTQRYWNRRLLIPLVGLLLISGLASCFTNKDGEGGLTNLDDDSDSGGRFEVTVELRNDYTLYFGQLGPLRGGSVQMVVVDVDSPPCCVVAEGNTRVRNIGVRTGEEWYIRAHNVSPGFTFDPERYAQARCRVTAKEPTALQPKPTLVVTYNTNGHQPSGLQLHCSGGWEPYSGS